MNLEKSLKYIIWAGLIGIVFAPLVVGKSYFFPYVAPKTLFFRVAVEIIFLVFLFLAVKKKEYRPKFNLVLILFSLYILAVAVSSFLADTFYFSFWSNNERSEGILLLIHLLMLLIVLSGFLRRTKDWLILFEVSFIASTLVSLIGFGQYFGFDIGEVALKGIRIGSTIGNAGYVAGYLIFNIFFGLFLFFSRKKASLRWYYLVGIALHIFVVLNTYTRGGILALAFSLLVLFAYLSFYGLKSNKIVRNSGLAILLIGVIFAGLLFFNRDADWAQSNPILRRIANISLESTTAENRLLTWQAAYEGFKDKPLLGYGYENFYQVFDKHFNPKIYRHAGSVVWFDRAHNIVFDRLNTGGIIGLLLYLGMLFAPLYYLWRYYLKSETRNYILPTIFTLIIGAYFLQNLFIFESLVTYIPLFFVLGFLSNFTPSKGDRFFQSKNHYLAVLTLYIILFIPLLFMVNIKPAQSNKGLVEAMMEAEKGNYYESYQGFVEVIEMDTFGNQEYRQHLVELVASQVNAAQQNEGSWVPQATIRTEQEFDKQIEEKPKSARNFLMFMRFLNKTYIYDVSRLEKSLSLSEEGIELSPRRPMFYTEAAYSQIYLGDYYKKQGDQEKAEQFFSQAKENMQKAIDLSPDVAESYVNMVSTLIFSGQTSEEAIRPYFNKIEELKGFSDVFMKDSLETLGSVAINAKEYEWTIKIYEKLVALSPDAPHYWVNLALSHAYLGKDEQAIELAEKIKEFGGDYAKEADLFIQNIRQGKFRQ